MATTTFSERISRYDVQTLGRHLTALKAQVSENERQLKELLGSRMSAWLEWKKLQHDYKPREFKFYRLTEQGIEFFTAELPTAGGYREELIMELSWSWIENPERVKLEHADRRALYEELKKEFEGE